MESPSQLLDLEKLIALHKLALAIEKTKSIHLKLQEGTELVPIDVQTIHIGNNASFCCRTTTGKRHYVEIEGEKKQTQSLLELLRDVLEPIRGGK